MSNGIAIFFGAAVIGIGVAASGTVTQFGKNVIAQRQHSACWNPDLTDGLSQAAAKIAEPQFKASLPPSLSVKERAAIITSFKINISNNAFTGMSSDGGTIHCEAGLSLSYTRPDGSVYSNNGSNIVTYIMHPSGNGWSYEMNRASFPLDIMSYQPARKPTASASQ